MKFWIISDTHFAHSNIIKWCGRKEGYEEVILKSIYDNVKHDDVLIHLGDVAWKHPVKWNQLLNTYCKGKTWLVKGNHDKQTHAWYLSKGWDFAADQFMMNRLGYNILFTHIPQPETRYYDINIHGHLHNQEHHDKEYQRIKHNNQILVQIEDCMGVQSLDSLINRHIKNKRM